MRIFCLWLLQVKGTAYEHLWSFFYGQIPLCLFIWFLYSIYSKCHNLNPWLQYFYLFTTWFHIVGQWPTFDPWFHWLLYVHSSWLHKYTNILGSLASSFIQKHVATTSPAQKVDEVHKWTKHGPVLRVWSIWGDRSIDQPEPKCSRICEETGLDIWIRGEILAVLQISSSDPQQPHKKHVSVASVLGERGAKDWEDPWSIHIAETVSCRYCRSVKDPVSKS